MRDSPTMTALQQLTTRLRDRRAIICIVGLGYVGLPLLLRYAEAGFHVVGIETDAAKVARLNQGRSYIDHIPSTDIARAREGRFESTTQFSRCGMADALIVCVPSPRNAYCEPDLSFVLETVDALLPFLRTGQIVSLESMAYSPAIEGELRVRLQSRGWIVGTDIFLVFAPEREDLSNVHFNTRTIPKLCSGSTTSCLDAGLSLYRPAIDRVVPVSATRAAELAKLLESTHRTVNIGLANEMKIIADKMEIDLQEVIRAAATKPFGFNLEPPVSDRKKIRLPSTRLADV